MGEHPARNLPMLLVALTILEDDVYLQLLEVAVPSNPLK